MGIEEKITFNADSMLRDEAEATSLRCLAIKVAGVASNSIKCKRSGRAGQKESIVLSGDGVVGLSFFEGTSARRSA